MPDISMCQNKECNMKESCYRYTAKPSEQWQSYSEFVYERDSCYIPINNKSEPRFMKSVDVA
jgi:hypothetical protein